MQTYLTIFEKVFEKYKEKAREEAENTYDEETVKLEKPLEFDTRFDIHEMYYEDGILNCSGVLRYDKEDLAYLHVAVEMSLEIFEEILKDYISKLNRIKTILEATKKL